MTQTAKSYSHETNASSSIKELSMKGHKNKCNVLWYIPICQSDQDTTYVIYDDTQNKYKQTVNSMYHTTTLAKTIQFIHQCLFLPTVNTFCIALDNDQLMRFSPITSAQVHKYLPASITTAKGQLR